MKQLKNERGLTLVELLAVIVILAIIAAIAAVAIGNVIQNSKDKAILSDAVAMYEGAKIAHMDNACKSDDVCTGTELQPFVEGVTLDASDKVKIVDNGGQKKYWIEYSKFNEIKNKDKYGVTAPVSEKDLINTLNGEKPGTQEKQQNETETLGE